MSREQSNKTSQMVKEATRKTPL